MKVLQNAPQGSAAWHAARSVHFCASEAAAAMGVSKYTTREALLRQKATGIAEEISPAKQRIFDAGHQAEADARPIAERLADVEFFPVVATMEIDGMQMLASFDGIDLLEEVVWENKLLNASLVEQVKGGNLEAHYWAQLEQQLLISGASRALFTTSDGTPEGTHELWYRSIPERRQQLIAAWKQFRADLAAYVPQNIKEMPAAEATLALPALFIHAKGEITTSNMQEYGDALALRLKQIRSIQLVNDQDFSNAKESAKLLRENIESAKLAKDAMLAQTVTVGEASRMIDTWCEDMRLTALQLEKDVEREDRTKKAAMIATAKATYDKHIQSLIAETGGPWIVLQAPDWATAIKNKRSFASMQDSLDTALANGKIAADASAKRIRESLSCINKDGAGFEFLFNDRLALIGKPVDDLQVLVRMRIADHKAAEAAKQEETRERIRLEEKEKLEREANEKMQRDMEASAKLMREEEAAAAAAAKPVEPAASPASVETPAANVVPMRVAAVPTPTSRNSVPTLRIGVINDRLKDYSVTAENLRSLGFEPAGRERAAQLYHDDDFVGMCDAIAERAMNAKAEYLRAKAVA